MKIIREPKVYLIGQQILLREGFLRFAHDEGIAAVAEDRVAEAEALIETAGRLCYMSFKSPRPGGNKAYLQHILESGHGSVLEHAVWNFIITNISRSCSHELVRHRAGWSYSQLSQRYVDESVAEYVEPDVIANDTLASHGRWQEAIVEAHRNYKVLIDNLMDLATMQRWPDRVAYDRANLFAVLPAEEKTKIRKQVRQAARSVLPNATETKIFVTVNARAARHFFELRASRHAEPEIRKLAYAMYQILVKEAPNLFGDYQAEQLEDGTFELTTPYRKV